MSKPKYQKLTNVEHVLHRPDMYIGSLITEPITAWVCKEGNVFEKDVKHNPGFLKLFDEIISNSSDEHKRNPKLNKIDVHIDVRGTIQIKDNGGIPVEKHKEYGGYIPEMIFSEMYSGSNFDDTEERTTVGTNGLGSVLVNIYSKSFTIDTADGKKQYTQKFSNNMAKKESPIIKPSKLKGTSITYVPDLERFNMVSIDDDHVLQLRKRCLDVAASNPGLSVNIIIKSSTSKESDKFKFKDFTEYIKFYLDDFTDHFFIKNKRADIAIVASDRGFYQKSFVNSVDTFGGGTHIRQIENQIIDFTRTYIKRKTKYDIKPSDVRNHFGIFANCLVTNPRFKGQTKEVLSTAAKDLGCDLTIPDKILKQIVKSDITASIMDWVDKKKAADEKAEMRKLNKKIGGALPINLLDAKTKRRHEAKLYIMEGKSAMSAVRKFRNPQIHGCYPLKGKFMNVLEKSNVDVIQNNEVQDLVKSLGLKLGEDAFEMVPLSGKKVKILLNDGYITVDENEEILVNGKWVLAKKLVNLKPKEVKIDLITKQVKTEVIKTKTKIITEEPVIDTSQVKGKEKEIEKYLKEKGLSDDKVKEVIKKGKTKGLF